MEFVVRNTHGHMPPYAKQYAEQKLKKLERYLHKAGEAEFVHDEQRGRHTIELQFNADGMSVRAHGYGATVRQAIDKAVARAEGRFKRTRYKLAGKHHHAEKKDQWSASPLSERDAETTATNIKRNPLTLKPLSLQEAALQMETLNQPYFLFKNKDTDQVALLTRTVHGGYELLEPED